MKDNNSKFDEEWWKYRKIINPLWFDDVMCDETISEKPGNWVLYGNYHSEPFAPAGGYRVLFPTSLDCLFWIRWVFLPYLNSNDSIIFGGDVELTGELNKFADEIDSNLGKGISKEFIESVIEKIIHLNNDQDLEIYNIQRVK